MESIGYSTRLLTSLGCFTGQNFSFCFAIRPRTASIGVDNTKNRPEWPLVKPSIIAGASFPVTAAVGDFHETPTGLVEQGVGFGPTF